METETVGFLYYQVDKLIAFIAEYEAAGWAVRSHRTMPYRRSDGYETEVVVFERPRSDNDDR